MMPSVIPGFEYDIFISYRQNDNRSGWVTEFVNALQEELAATIKEPISIYFDKNPHDGLLETHSVGKSLEGKLKCLIFIPIISQTYCDPKSFAWQNEFCAFNKQAKEDQLGLDINLHGGNVASRILPVKIHDLDMEDKATIETEIGGALRAIDFIFKSSGVNRPLRLTEDHPHDNLNRTFYRDQINKVANSIKEIIGSLKSLSAEETKSNRLSVSYDIKKPSRKNRNVLATIVIFALLVGSYFVLFRRDVFIGVTSTSADKSVAVLAFDDLSPQHDQEWFADGLAEDIMNNLSHVSQLKVTARTSAFHYKNKDLSIQQIGKELGVAHLVEGSVRRIGNQFRISAKLILVQDGFQIWSEEYERPADDLSQVQAQIAERVALALVNKLTEHDRALIFSGAKANGAAHESFLKGSFFHDRYRNSDKAEDFEKAEKNFMDAIAKDPRYADAYGELANLYDSFGPEKWSKRDSLIKIGIQIDPHSIPVLEAKTFSFLKYPSRFILDSSFKAASTAYIVSHDDFAANYAVAGFYWNCGLLDKAEEFYQHLISIDPLSPTNYHFRGSILLQQGKLDEAQIMLSKASELNSDIPFQDEFLLSVIKKDSAEFFAWLKNPNKKNISNLNEFVNVMANAFEGKEQLALQLASRLRPRSANWATYLVHYLTNSSSEQMIRAFNKLWIDIDYAPRGGMLSPFISSQELEGNILYDAVRDSPDFKKALKRAKERDREFRIKFDLTRY